MMTCYYTARNQFSKSLAQETFHYNDGVLTWRIKGSGRRKTVGGSNMYGYKRFNIKSIYYLSHVVIWNWHNGLIPDGLCIDHINRITSDNRIDNLRVVTPKINRINTGMAPDNTSGVTGVHFHKAAGKWAAVIQVSGKRNHLGVFSDFEEAKAVRLAAEQERERLYFSELNP